MSGPVLVEAPLITNLDPVPSWLGMAMGAAAMALREDERPCARWAGNSLWRLIPVIEALLEVARQHPEEFERALKEPVKLEPMP